VSMTVEALIELRNRTLDAYVDGQIIRPERRPAVSVAWRYARATSPGRLRARATIPATLTTASTGTAAFAARGGSTSSKNGTGSPHSDCIGPTGQSPWPTMSAAPSTVRKATPAHRRRLRRRVNTETQISLRHQSCATDQDACRTRHARARPPSVAQLTTGCDEGARPIALMGRQPQTPATSGRSPPRAP
jgi:hypothetical protein